MKKNNNRIPLILGGGLTGLSAAYNGGGIVFEKDSQYGGTCQSPLINGYTFDLGIHVLHTKNEYVLSLLNKLGLQMFDQSRDAWIYSYETLTRYPFQANTFGLPVPIVKECLESFIKTWGERKYPDNVPVCSNYDEWIRAVFGNGIADYFMVPYSEKFWTVSPDQMTTDWLDVRIPMPEIGEVIEGALTEQTKGFGPNMLFKYPVRYGIQALPMAFAESGIEIRLNKEAEKINLKNRTVTFKDGETCFYSSLISTLPLPELFKLFDASDEIKIAVNDLKYNSILCVNLGVNKKSLNEKHWIYYPEKDFPFFRISFLKNFASYMTPDRKSSITAEIAYSESKPINSSDIETLVIDGLIKAGILENIESVEFIDIQDLKYGYVIYDHIRPKALALIKSFLRTHGIITAGRYGSWEYQWMDDAILDGRRAAEEAGDIMNTNQAYNG